MNARAGFATLPPEQTDFDRLRVETAARIAAGMMAHPSIFQGKSPESVVPKMAVRIADHIISIVTIGAA